MLNGNALLVLVGYFVGQRIEMTPLARREAEALLVRHGLLDLVEGEVNPIEGTARAPALVVKINDRGLAHVEGLRAAPLPEARWISPLIPPART